MGDDSVILRGASGDTKEQRAALYSTVHGAGRVMSRTEARGKINRKTGEVKTRGAISRGMLEQWIGEKNVILRGGGVDEAPQVYRRLRDVLAGQGSEIDVGTTLRPLA